MESAQKKIVKCITNPYLGKWHSTKAQNLISKLGFVKNFIFRTQLQEKFSFIHFQDFWFLHSKTTIAKMLSTKFNSEFSTPHQLTVLKSFFSNNPQTPHLRQPQLRKKSLTNCYATIVYPTFEATRWITSNLFHSCNQKAFVRVNTFIQYSLI